MLNDDYKQFQHDTQAATCYIIPL